MSVDFEAAEYPKQEATMAIDFHSKIVQVGVIEQRQREARARAEKELDECKRLDQEIALIGERVRRSVWRPFLRAVNSYNKQFPFKIAAMQCRLEVDMKQRTITPHVVIKFSPGRMDKLTTLEVASIATRLRVRFDHELDKVECLLSTNRAQFNDKQY